MNGFRDEKWKAELSQIETKRRELEALLARQPEPLFALHPHLADVFKQRVEVLVRALESPNDIERGRACDAVRALVVKIKVPADGLLRVVGDLGEMLTAAGGAAVGQGGCGGGI